MLSRDIRLTAEQIIAARDACTRRRRELERRIERTSYDGKPGMKTSVLTELATLRELERVFEHNREQIARQLSDTILDTPEARQARAYGDTTGEAMGR